MTTLAILGLILAPIVNGIAAWLWMDILFGDE